MDSHTIKIRQAFRLSIPFWKIFGNRCRSMWRSYPWSRMTRLCTPHVELETLGVLMYKKVTYTSTKRWTLTLPKFDEPFGPRFHFKRFLGTDVDRCEGPTLGWGRHDSIHPRVELESLWGYHVYVHDNHVHQRRDGLSHYQNSTSLSALGSIFF